MIQKQSFLGQPGRLGTTGRITEMFRLIDREDFPSALRKIDVLAKTLGKDDPELVRARGLIAFLVGDE